MISAIIIGLLTCVPDAAFGPGDNFVPMHCVASATTSTPRPGVERWPIKTSVPDGTDFNRPLEFSIEKLIALPDVETVTKNDRRFQSARIPDEEGDLIVTEGWLWLVAAEGDGDYHVQLSASKDSGDPCFIVEVPDPAFAPNPDLRRRYRAVRDFFATKIMHPGKRPSAAGTLLVHPVKVRVTGVLFYDDSHVGDQPRGKKGMKAGTLFELHPVTGIEFAKP